jgi:hypothetical protein
MPTVRLPLAFPIQSRQADPFKDAKMVNAYKEADQVLKRPGLSHLVVAPALPTDVGQGVFAYNQALFTCINNELYKVEAGVSTLIGSISGDVKPLYWTSTFNNNYLFFHNQSKGYVYDAVGGLDEITTPFFPTDLVPGVGYLDTYVAVMNVDGRIYTSDPADPTTWNALNYVSSTSQPDLATGISSHLNYIVAFNQWSMQFFYDVGTSTGSPLLSNASANLEIGCANGNSLVKFEQTLAWVGQSNTAGKGVYLLNGIVPIKVSNQYIDKYLDADTCDSCKATGIKYNGHSWYILTLPDSDLTFVYDIDEKIWTFWSSVQNGLEQYFVGNYATSLNGHSYLQDSINGELYKLDQDTYIDADGVINFRLVSPLIDAETQYRKTIIRVEIIGDKNDTVLRIRHTDNDYQTWSMYRNVNLSDARPVLFQNGITRRRAYEFFNNDDTFIRLAFLELDLTVGDN